MSIDLSSFEIGDFIRLKNILKDYRINYYITNENRLVFLTNDFEKINNALHRFKYGEDE